MNNLCFEVDWCERWANRPSIHLVGGRPDSKPTSDGFWEKRGGLHRRDNQDTTVSYFYTDGKPNQGYGGQRFDGRLVNGGEFHYKGAWSSRAECVNELWPESPIVDVVWDHMATAIPVTVLAGFVTAIDQGFGLAICKREGGGMVIEPTRPDGSIKAGSTDLILARLEFGEYHKLHEFVKIFITANEAT